MLYGEHDLEHILRRVYSDYSEGMAGMDGKFQELQEGPEYGSRILAEIRKIAAHPIPMLIAY